MSSELRLHQFKYSFFVAVFAYKYKELMQSKNYISISPFAHLEPRVKADYTVMGHLPVLASVHAHVHRHEIIGNPVWQEEMFADVFFASLPQCFGSFPVF